MRRHFRLTWWVQRLAPQAESVIPPPWIIRALAWSYRHSDEPELAILPHIVPADRIAIDVGAADGVYTFELARLARACVAFEANPDSADRIRRRVPTATVHAVALSDGEGDACLRVPIVNGTPLTGWATVEAANTLASLPNPDVRSLTVARRTLDSFALDDVGFIKIDVEGHELAVLRGAAETVRRCRPTVLVEVQDQFRPGAGDSIARWFHDENYAAAALPAASEDRRPHACAAYARNLIYMPCR